MLQKWSVTLFCGSVICITFFYQLGNLAFIGADEPRYARVGGEMNLRGAYVTLTLELAEKDLAFPAELQPGS